MKKVGMYSTLKRRPMVALLSNATHMQPVQI